MSYIAPHALFPAATQVRPCAECGAPGPMGARNAKIPQGREHDACRLTARRRREERATEAARVRKCA